MIPPPPRFPLFPYTTLFRSRSSSGPTKPSTGQKRPARAARSPRTPAPRDRKSTRLNSSHGYISYAVFCLKKKKKKTKKNLFLKKKKKEQQTVQTEKQS